MKKYKLPLILLLFMGINTTATAKDEKGGAKLKEHKQKILAKIEERQTLLKKLRDCVKAAQDGNQLKSCRDLGGQGIGRDTLFEGTGVDSIN